MKKMLINRIKYTATLLLMFFCIGNLQAQNKAYARASATIVEPVGALKLEDLDFGDFIATKLPGSITVNPVNIRSVNGGINQSSNDNVARAASFEIHHSNSMYAISTPDKCIQLTRQSGNETMEIDLFSVEDVATGTHPLSPNKITLGATLFVNGSQPAGRYFPKESPSIIINYN